MNANDDDCHRLGLAAAISAIACWGTGNVMVRFVDLDALALAFWRLALGAVVYTCILVARGRRLTWAQIRTCLPAAMLTGLWLVAFYEALKSTTIANVTLLGSLMPLILFAVAARRFAEPVSLWLFAMAAAALAGTALVLFGSTSAASWSARGDGIALLALLMFSAYFALAKQARLTVGALEFQAVAWIGGTLVVAPVAAVGSGGLQLPSGQQWAWVAVLLAIPGSGHLLMNWAHRHVRLTVTSMATLGAAPVSMVGAAIFLDEPLGVAQIAGAGAVIAALAAVIRRETRLLSREAARS